MNTLQKKNAQKERRHARIRTKIFGTAKRPRLAVFKSNRYIYAQIIDDGKGVTLASSSSLKEKKGTMKEKAEKVGAQIAKLAAEKKIQSVVFDRGGSLYAGNIKVLAESARKEGLSF